MDFCNLKGKKIIVTGASSGLGRAICIKLSNLGATVFLVARDEDRLVATMKNMNGDGHKLIPFDLNNFNDYEQLFEILKPHGCLSGLVHFAGIRKTLPIRSTKVNDLKEIFNINLFAFMELVRFFSKKNTVHHDGASIVVASSVLSLRGAAALAGYSASKAAVDGAVRCFACELASKKIRVNSIAPGHVETEMNLAVRKQISEEAYEYIIKSHPLGIGRPADVANLVAFLISDEARWITGAVIPIDGGFSARS